MTRHTLATLLLTLLLAAPLAAQDAEHIVAVRTTLGTMKFKLFNDTPDHRDTFLRLARKGQYDSTLFYRVIREFMIQGGSSDSRHARPGQTLGYGREITIPAEILPQHYHQQGALAAPRQPDEVNADKDSDISQFYIVHGHRYTPDELTRYVKSINNPLKRAIQQKYYVPRKPLLDSLRAARDTVGFRRVAAQVKAQLRAAWAKETRKVILSPDQREAYTTRGGSPHLDGEYTVFGQMIEGFDVLDRIAKLPVDKNNRPLQDVRIISVTVIQ